MEAKTNVVKLPQPPLAELIRQAKAIVLAQTPYAYLEAKEALVRAIEAYEGPWASWG